MFVLWAKDHNKSSELVFSLSSSAQSRNLRPSLDAVRFWDSAPCLLLESFHNLAPFIFYEQYHARLGDRKNIPIPSAAHFNVSQSCCGLGGRRSIIKVIFVASFNATPATFEMIRPAVKKIHWMEGKKHLPATNVEPQNFYVRFGRSWIKICSAWAAAVHTLCCQIGCWLPDIPVH